MKLSTVFHAYREAEHRRKIALINLATNGGGKHPHYWTTHGARAFRQVRTFGAWLERELNILDIVLDDHMDYAPTPEETKRLMELGMESYRRVLAKLDK